MLTVRSISISSSSLPWLFSRGVFSCTRCIAEPFPWLRLMLKGSRTTQLVKAPFDYSAGLKSFSFKSSAKALSHFNPLQGSVSQHVFIIPRCNSADLLGTDLATQHSDEFTNFPSMPLSFLHQWTRVTAFQLCICTLFRCNKFLTRYPKNHRFAFVHSDAHTQHQPVTKADDFCCAKFLKISFPSKPHAIAFLACVLPTSVEEPGQVDCNALVNLVNLQ